MDDSGYQWLPAYTIERATEIIGTRTRVFELLRSGELVGLKSGRRTLITGDSLRKYLESRPRARYGPDRQADQQAA